MLAAVLVLCAPAAAFRRGAAPPSGAVPFAALHTYFMSPSGSDANSGLDAAHAWASPNHAVVCGDVIIAAAGSYSIANTQSGSWGTVSSCPSASGGIDGAGGVYFATVLCGGSYVGACSVVSSGSGGAIGNVDIDKSNWAIEGFAASGGYTCAVAGAGFSIDTSVNNGIKHHIAFINDIAYHNGWGFAVASLGSNSGSGWGADYWAIVGNIAQDSAGRCDGGVSDSAIDIIGIANYDAGAGTHIFVAGNFAFNCQQTLGASDNSDGECYMFDTLDLPTPGYSRQIVFRDNIGALSERFNLQVFYQGFTSTTPTIKIYNNTLVASNQMNYSTGSGSNQGGINIQGSGGAMPWIVPVTNNIARETKATAGGGEDVFAVMNGGSATTTIGASGSENVIYGLFTGACPGALCDTGHATVSQVSYTGALGTNFYEDAAFANLSDALTNRMGTPNCAGFLNTAACMGENFGAAPSSLTLIGDLVPSSTHSSGKGRRSPTNCVATDSDYPAWLKGVVYLRWTGSAIVESQGLVTKPCGM